MQQMDKTTGTQDGQAPGAASGPPVGPPAAAQPAPPAKRKPPVVVIGVLAVALLAGGVFGAKWWNHRQAFVSTDDAQVAGNLVNVSSRVPGHLAELKVDEGQMVKAGQVIATLDTTDYQAQLAQSRAALAVAQSNLGSSQTNVALQSSTTAAQISQATAGLSATQANLGGAEANAQKAQEDLNRAAKLFHEGALSRQAYDAARTAATGADQAVAAARSQVSSAREGVNLAQTGTQQVAIRRSGVNTVQAQIMQAQAAVDLAKLNLDHTTLTAPVNGLVARRMANVGEQVQPGQGLFSIAETDNVWVTANIEETNIRRVQNGEDVEVQVDAFPKRTFHGKVSFVNAVTGGQFSVLPQNNAAGNFTKVVQRIPVKILVDDPNHELKPGMSAVVDIDTHASR